MKVLLTGGTGFIGQVLLRDHSQNNEFVVLTSRNDTAGLYKNDAISYVYFNYGSDSTNSERIEESLIPLLEGVDGVAHLGFARSSLKNEERLNRYLPSVALSEGLLHGCSCLGIKNIVNCSSTSVYSERRDGCGRIVRSPHAEEEAPRPKSLYAASKLYVENMAQLYNATEKLCVKSLRIAQVLGRNEHQGILHTYLNKIINDKPLFIWGNGNEIEKEYVYVRDVANAVMAALNRPDVSGVYNVGTGETITVSGLACALLEAFGKNPEDYISYCPEKEVAPAYWCLSCESARQALGWSARWTIREAIEAVANDKDELY